MFLWYMANTNTLRELLDKFNVAQSTAHGVVMKALEATCQMAAIHIHWPSVCEKVTRAVVFNRL